MDTKADDERAVAEVLHAVGAGGADQARTALVVELAERGGKQSQWVPLLSAAKCLAAKGGDASVRESRLVGAAMALGRVSGPDALAALCELACVLPPPFRNEGWQRNAISAVGHLVGPVLTRLLGDAAKDASLIPFSWRAFPVDLESAWRERTTDARVGLLVALGRGLRAAGPVGDGSGAIAIHSASRAIRKAAESAFRGSFACSPIASLCELARECADAGRWRPAVLILARALRAGFSVPLDPGLQDAEVRRFEASQAGRTRVQLGARRAKWTPPARFPALHGAVPAATTIPLGSSTLEMPEDIAAAAFAHLVAGLGCPTPETLSKRRAREVMDAVAGSGQRRPAHTPPAARAEPPAPLATDERAALPRWVSAPPPQRGAASAWDAFLARRDEAEDAMLSPAGTWHRDSPDRQWVARYQDPETGQACSVLLAMSDLPRVAEGFVPLAVGVRPPPAVEADDACPALVELAQRLCRLPKDRAFSAMLPAPMRRDGRLGEHARWLIDSGRGDETLEHRAYVDQMRRAPPPPACPLE